MKHFVLIFIALFVTACSQAQLDPPATESEERMAEMMGITVLELRAQTPQEHMKAMEEVARQRRMQNN